MINPSHKDCFKICHSCWRCSDKGRYARCNSCSGRHDPALRLDPYDIDDRCRCPEGILQFRVKTGQLIKKNFVSNPFAGKVITDAETTDEKEWNQFIQERREQLGIPDWDPVRFDDGESTYDWTQRQRAG